jgi:hypothetical protein
MLNDTTQSQLVASWCAQNVLSLSVTSHVDKMNFMMAYIDLVEDMAMDGDLAVAAYPGYSMAVCSTQVVMDVVIIVTSLADLQ